MVLLELAVPATLEGVSTLRRAFRRSMSELRLPDEVVDDLQLAVSEVGSNIVRHGLPQACEIRLMARLERHLIRVEIADDGGSFDAFQERIADAESARGAARIGGMGLDLIRTNVDGIQYLPGRPNRLVLTRRVHGRRPRVLLIEDDMVLREVYRAMLAPHFVPVVAGSMAEAKLAMASTPADVIVSDFHLADGKGSQASELLGAPGQQLPVPLLILTADRRPTLQSMLLREGVDAILSKPITSRDLTGAVRGALARSARQQAAVMSGLGGSFSQFTMALDGASVPGWRAGHAHSAAGRGGGDVAFVVSRSRGARLVVADVMGHGVEARIAALGLAGALRALAASADVEAKALLRSLNAAMIADPALGRVFATAQVVDLEDDGAVSIASAGHPEPWIVDASGMVRRVAVDGPAPGLLTQATYDAAGVRVGMGERLLLMTDGINPADMSGGGEMPSWLSGAIVRSCALPVGEAAVLLGQAARAAEPLEQTDDWTIVVLEPLGRQPAER